MVYTANGIYPLKVKITNDINSLAVSNKGILACHGYSFEEYPEAFDMYLSSDRAISLGSGIIFSLWQASHWLVYLWKIFTTKNQSSN